MVFRVNYFKQYGEIRTGTNYLMRLIELNFKSTTVFGSILGWKHGTYGLTNCIDSTINHEDWIKQKTKNGVVYSVDNYPVKYTPVELLRSLKYLKYIFSIKKPQAYVVSYKKFRFPKRPLDRNMIEMICNRYNDRYRVWKEMYITNKHNSIVVPYESVIHDFSHVLFSLQSQFNLQCKHSKYINERNTVKASTDVGLNISNQQFRADYYLNEYYLDELSSDQINLINDNIDHELVDYFYSEGV